MRKTLAIAITVSFLLSLLSVLIYTTPTSAQPDPKEKPSPGNGPRVLLDMLPLSFPEEPYIEDDVTMVPLRALAEALGVTVEWRAETEEAVCQNGPVRLSLKIGHSQAKKGDTIVPLSKPVSRRGDTMMVPLRFFSETMGFTVKWDEKTHTVFVESPRRPLGIWGFYALGSLSYSSWQDLFGDKYPYVKENSPASSMEGVFLGWFAIDENGQLTSSGHPSGFAKPDGWPAVLLHARLRGLRCFAMYFGSNEKNRLSGLLRDPLRRRSLVQDLAVSSREYDGVLLDFEGLGASPEAREEDAKNLNLFIDELKEALEGRPLAVAVPPPNGHFQGYDHTHIGQKADLVVLLAYDYQEPGRPSPVAPWDKVDEAIEMEKALVSKDKILLGIPAFGTLYRISEEKAELVSKPAAKDSVSPVKESSGLEKTFDPDSSCERLRWRESGESYEGFLESFRSLEARVNLAERHGIRGVAIWRLGLLPEDWWEAVLKAVEPRRAGKN